MSIEIPKITEKTFTIILPKKDNSGNYIKLDVLSDKVKSLASHFGGVTILPNANGCYKSGGKLICEEMFEVQLSRDFSNPYSDDKLIKEFREKCTTENLDNINTQRCIKLAKQISEEDEKFIMEEVEKIGKELGQDTIFVREEVDENIKMISGSYKEKLPEEKTMVKLL